MAEPGPEQNVQEQPVEDSSHVETARNAARAEMAARRNDERQEERKRLNREAADVQKREQLLRTSRMGDLKYKLANGSLEAIDKGSGRFEGESPKQLLDEAYKLFITGSPADNKYFNKDKVPGGTEADIYQQAYQTLKVLARNLAKDPPKDFNAAQLKELHDFIQSSPGELSINEMKERVGNLNSKTPFGGKFYEYTTNEQLTQSYPDSVEQLAQWVMDFEGEDYRLGGKYELVNSEGEVQLHNFLRWFRSRMIYYHTLSPDSPEVSFFGAITILLPLNRLSLGDLLGNDRFWRKQVKGELGVSPVARDEKGNLIMGVGSDAQVIDYEPYQHFREYLLMEAFLFENSRNLDAKYRQIMGNEKGLFEMLQGSFTFNVYTQDENRMQLTWRIPGTSEAQMDLIKNADYPEKEGTAGKGVRVSDVLYYHMGELEYFPNNPHDNAFFETLGPEGTKMFYQSIIKRNLNKNLSGDKFRSFGDFSLAIKQGEKLDGFLKFAGILDGSSAKDSEGKVLERADYLTILSTKDTKKRKALLAQYEGEIRKILSKDLITEQIRHFEDDPVLAKKFLAELESRVGKTLQILSSVNGEDLKASLMAKGWSADQVSHVDNYTSNPEKFALLTVQNFILSNDQTSRFYKKDDQGRPKVDFNNIRVYMNIFNENSKPKELISLMRGAVRDSIGGLYDLDSMESEFAESIAYSKARWTGSAARNDTTATGFDAWTKLLRFKEYRLGQKGKGDIGSIYNINGLQRLNVTYWEAMNGTVNDGKGNARKITLLEAMQGSEGDVKNSALNAELKKINISYNLERTFGENHLGRGFELYSYLLYQVDAGFDELIKYDDLGQASVDHKKMADLWNKTYKAIRYTYTQMGFPHENLVRDVYQEYERDSGRDLTFEHGRLELRPKLKKRLVYKSRKLKETMFDDEVLNMGLYDRHQFDDKWTGGKVGKGELNEFSRNILGYLIGKEVEANRDPHNPDRPRQWTINEVELLRQYFNNYPLEIDPTATSRGTNFLTGQQKGRYRRVRVQSGFFSNDEMGKIFGIAKSRKRILWWGIFWRLFFGTLFTATTATFQQAGKVKLS